MLPSLLARDIQQGLQQFLITGFEPSDDFLHGLISRFVQEPAAWLKGPYLQVGLPYTAGASGRRQALTWITWRARRSPHSSQPGCWATMGQRCI